MGTIKRFFTMLFLGMIRLDFSRAYYITQQTAYRTPDNRAFKFGDTALYKRVFIRTNSTLTWRWYTRIWTPIMIYRGRADMFFGTFKEEEINSFRRLKRATDAQERYTGAEIREKCIQVKQHFEQAHN